jgi:LysM repeat protein
MSNSRRTAGTLWAYGALFAAMAGGAALIARERGWLDSVPQLKRTGPAKIELAASDLDDAAPSPFDRVEFDGDGGTRMSPSESDEPAPEHGRHDAAELKISLSLDDSIDDDSADSGRPKIATAGFEENAPPAPSSPQDEPAGERISSGANKPAVAARPTDTTKAVGSARNGAATLTRSAPLMDRDRIEQLIDEGEFVEAQKELSRWYWQNPDEQEEVLPQLNKMAQALYFSPQPLYYEPYVVKPGDQLRVVGQRYKISWEYIARLNRVDARKIRMGQKLKVVPGPFAVTIFLDRYELVVHQNGSFVKNYRVGVGKDGTTPIGTFTVKNKMVDPTYYGPEGVIAHDDPNNPLGERWIDIGDSYGIHGTIDPDSIGKNESRGCIRMLNSDVEEVYDFLVIGSEVKIQK